ncbi:MAG: IS3 family transposase, partial [Flavobacterium sp.]
EEWIIEYNERRPHEALNNLTPNEWHKNLLKNENALSNTV